MSTVKRLFVALIFIATLSTAPTAHAAYTISQGGTGTSTQVTNGVNYFDGSKITSSNVFTFNGSKLTAAYASSTAITATNFYGTLTGNAATATKLATSRAINTVNFDGSADITITAASSTLLANANTFSGVNLFTNASSNFSGTWQTFSPSHFLTVAPIATSSAESAGQLAAWATTAGTPAKLYSVATTTASCSGTASCSSFTVLGSSPVTITGSAGTTASSTLLSDNNTFSGTNTFSGPKTTTTNASTTALSVSSYLGIPTSSSCGSTAGATCLDTTENQIQVGTSTAYNTVAPTRIDRGFTYSTSTTATGTTTKTLMSIMPSSGETLRGVRCFSPTGTWNVQFGNGTASTTMLNASSTNNFMALGKSFAQGDILYVSFGTPASSPTSLNCTTETTVNPS